MKHLRKNGGFTLVELVVSIAVASLVTMAATTVLLLALRVNRQTADTASQQNTVRALLTTMENAAMNGSIKSVKTDHLNYWELLDKEDNAIFRYSAFDETISVNGIVVLEDIYASNAVIEDNLLSIVLVTKDETFQASVYCRTLELKQEGGETGKQPSQVEPSVENFIRILISQFGSTGIIQTGENADRYYSQWYIGDDVFNDGSNDWNASTPWCACYVSWALTEAGIDYPRTVNGQTVHWYSHVDKFEAYFDPLGKSPTAGALIFFNLDDDAVADHIGVVVNVHGGTIYTIEGNNDGKVTIARYDFEDPRILGYGVLNWN